MSRMRDPWADFDPSVPPTTSAGVAFADERSGYDPWGDFDAPPPAAPSGLSAGQIGKSVRVHVMDTARNLLERAAFTAGERVQGRMDPLGGTRSHGLGPGYDTAPANNGRPLNQVPRSQRKRGGVWDMGRKAEADRGLERRLDPYGVQAFEEARDLQEYAAGLAPMIEDVIRDTNYVRSSGFAGLVEDAAGAGTVMAGSVAAGIATSAVAGPGAGIGVAALTMAAVDSAGHSADVYRKLRERNVPDERAREIAMDSGMAYALLTAPMEHIGLRAATRIPVVGDGVKRVLGKLAESKLGRAVAKTAGVGLAAGSEGATEVAQGITGEALAAWAMDDWASFKESWNDWDTRSREFAVGAMLGGGMRLSGVLAQEGPGAYQSFQEWRARAKGAARAMGDSSPIMGQVPIYRDDGTLEYEQAPKPGDSDVSPVSPSPKPSSGASEGRSAEFEAKHGPTGAIVEEQRRAKVRKVGAEARKGAQSSGVLVANLPPQPDVRVDGADIFSGSRRADADRLMQERNSRLIPGDEPQRVVSLLGGQAWAVVPESRVKAIRQAVAQQKAGKAIQAVQAAMESEAGPKPDLTLANGVAVFGGHRKPDADALAEQRTEEGQPSRVTPLADGAGFAVVTDATPSALADTAQDQQQTGVRDTAPETSGEAAAAPVESPAVDRPGSGTDAREGGSSHEGTRERFSQRIIDAADRILEGVEARQKARGTRFKAGIDPVEFADVVLWGAAKIVQGTARFGQWSTLMVERFGESIRPRLREVWAQSRQVATRLNAGLNDPRAKDRVAAALAKANAKDPVEPKRGDSGLPADMLQTKALPRNTAERKAIAETAARMRRMARREIVGLQIRVNRLEKKAADAETRAGQIEALRAEANRIVEETLPPQDRDRPRKEAGQVRTFADMRRFLNNMRRALARRMGRVYLKQIKALAGPKARATAKIEDRTRKLLKQIQDEALVLRKVLVRRTDGSGPVPTTFEMEAAADGLMVLRDRAAIIRRMDRLDLERIVGDQRTTVRDFRDRIVEAVSKRPNRAVDRTSDVKTGALAAANLASKDLLSIAESIDGGVDGPVASLFRMLTTIEERYGRAHLKNIRAYNKAAKEAGYESWDDFKNRSIASRGSGTAEWLTVDLASGPMVNGPRRAERITVGEALELVAAAGDVETAGLIERGAKIKFQRGRNRLALDVTLEEIDAIREQLGTRVALIPAVRAMMQAKRKGVGLAQRHTTGREPEWRGEDYFPRSRDLSGSEDLGKARLWENVGSRMLENLSLVQKRTGGLSDIVIGEFAYTVEEHISNMDKIAILSVGVRQAMAIMESKPVRDAITTRMGSAVVDAVDDYLAAASMVNEQITTRGGRMVAWLNANLAAYYLGLSPKTWLVQVTSGLSRVAAVDGGAVVAEGLAAPASIPWTTMLEHSGYGVLRYMGSASSRFSFVHEPGIGRTGSPVAIAALDRAWKNVVAALEPSNPRRAQDMLAAYRALREASMSPLEILQFFDSINFRVAFIGHYGIAKKENPTWSEDRLLDHAGRKVAEVVRETQNASSQLDMPLVGLRSRDSALAAFFLFSSDRFKTRNRIARANRRGNLGPVLLAEAASIASSVGVGVGVALVVELLVAALFGDQDDMEDVVKRAFSADRLLSQAATEVAGLIEPVMLPQVVGAAAYGVSDRDRAVDAAALEAVDSVLDSLVEGPAAVAEGDWDKAADRLEDAIRQATGMLGLNPLGNIWERVDRQMERMERAGSVEGLR